MKFLTLILLTTLILDAHSNDKNPKDRDAKYDPSEFVVIDLNSPVKGPIALFQIQSPPGFEIDTLRVRLVKSNDLKGNNKNFEVIKVEGGRFSINVVKLPPGFYKLHVQVKDKKAQEHTYRSKYHDYVRVVIDDSVEVPWPDPVKNNATISGVDSDNDGIRDDVQRFINLKYANNLKMKLAAKQFATYLQQVLLTIQDKQTNIEMMKKEINSYICWDGISPTDSNKNSKELVAKIVNTKERAVAHKKADLNFHGQVTTLPDSDLIFCDFKTE